jgi:Zn-dependent protease with chaperone function
MSLLEFVTSYFTSSVTLSLLGGLYSSVGVLTLGLRSSRNNPVLRSRLLVSLFALLTLGWFLLASSVYFCAALVRVYEQVGDSVVIPALSFALLASLIATLPIAIIATKVVPRALLSGLGHRLGPPPAGASSILERIKHNSGVGVVRLLLSSSAFPFAYSMGSGENSIVVSAKLLEMLGEDELETVLGHEIAHIKNSDTRLKILLSAYRRVLFFDPLLKYLETTLDRETEFAADEFSANLTRRPLSLASALLKISAGDFPLGASHFAMSVLENGGQFRPSAMKARVIRLLAISDRMNHLDSSKTLRLFD